MNDTHNKPPLDVEIVGAVTNRINQWHAEHNTATLTEIENKVDAELAQLRREIVEGVLEERSKQAHKRVLCPNCGREMVRNGKRKRQLHSKGGETLVFNRQQMRCLNCGTTLFPPG